MMMKKRWMMVGVVCIVALWCAIYFRPVWITAQAAEVIATTYASTQDPSPRFTVHHTDLQSGILGRYYVVRMGSPKHLSMNVYVDVWTGKVLRTLQCCG